MPETRLEKGVFLLGLIVIATLGYLVVRSSHHHAAAKPTRPATTASTARVTTALAATAPTTTASRTAIALTLTASRGGSWLEARDGSSNGRVLYRGVLAQGRTRSFHTQRVWVLFGAAGNVDARVDRRSTRLPVGTYSALFDASGFQRARS